MGYLRDLKGYSMPASFVPAHGAFFASHAVLADCNQHQKTPMDILEF